MIFVCVYKDHYNTIPDALKTQLATLSESWYIKKIEYRMGCLFIVRVLVRVIVIGV